MLLLFVAEGIVGMLLVGAFLRKGSRRLIYSQESTERSFRAVLESQYVGPISRSKIHLVPARPKPNSALAAPARYSPVTRLFSLVLGTLADAITFLMRQFWVRVLGARIRPRQSYAD